MQSSAVELSARVTAQFWRALCLLLVPVAASPILAQEAPVKPAGPDTLPAIGDAAAPPISFERLQGRISAGDGLQEIPAAFADREGLYAEPRTLLAFARMHEAARKDGVELFIVSAFRSYTHQRAIWERKWDDHAADTPTSQRVHDIMLYTAMPGTSRHHWGTDLDLNHLGNGWFEHGEGLKTYRWLRAHAGEYGFCEVYSQRGPDRPAGYLPEKWHWSYVPVASTYLEAFVKSPTAQTLSGFRGAGLANEFDWFNAYVLGINPNCMAGTMPAPLTETVSEEAPVPVPKADQETRPSIEASCPGTSWPLERLAMWKEQDFELGMVGDADALARLLVECLDDPDPVIRDDIAYAGLAALMRGEALSLNTLRNLLETLSTHLAGDASDENGLAGPSAALALAEVARTDRMSPWMSDQERVDLLGLATSYLTRRNDDRALDNADRWRHGVAHASDILMQLSLNEKVTADQAGLMIDAIALQAGTSRYAYTHGEPRRLARPVLYIAQRELLQPDDWRRWFEQLSDRAPLADESDAYRDEASLNRVRNLTAFASALIVALESHEDERFTPLRSGAHQLLAAMR